VSAANAKDAAAKWIEGAQLPEDLRGRKVQLVTFESDEHCLFFYPRRVLKWQQQVTTYRSRAIRTRKGRVIRLLITPEMYTAWLEAEGKTDSASVRRAYADGCERLLAPEESAEA